MVKQQYNFDLLVNWIQIKRIFTSFNWT